MVKPGRKYSFPCYHRLHSSPPPPLSHFHFFLLLKQPDWHLIVVCNSHFAVIEFVQFVFFAFSVCLCLFEMIQSQFSYWLTISRYAIALFFCVFFLSISFFFCSSNLVNVCKLMKVPLFIGIWNIIREIHHIFNSDVWRGNIR